MFGILISKWEDNGIIVQLDVAVEQKLKISYFRKLSLIWGDTNSTCTLCYIGGFCTAQNIL
jgi:hypothetical protein